MVSDQQDYTQITAPTSEQEAGIDAGKGSVFISHMQGADDHLARYLCHELTNQRYQVYLDLNNPLGIPFLEIMEKELDKADYFLVLLHVESIKSDWVKEEARQASERNKRKGKPRIIPVRIGLGDRLYPPDLGASLSRFPPVEWNSLKRNKRGLLEKLVYKIEEKYPVEGRQTRNFTRSRWVLVASVIVLLLAAGFLYYLHQQSLLPTQTTSQEISTPPEPKDHPPQVPVNAGSSGHKTTPTKTENSNIQPPSPPDSPTLTGLQPLETWVKNGYKAKTREAIVDAKEPGKRECIDKDCRQFYQEIIVIRDYGAGGSQPRRERFKWDGKQWSPSQ